MDEATATKIAEHTGTVRAIDAMMESLWSFRDVFHSERESDNVNNALDHLEKASNLLQARIYELREEDAS